MKKLTRYFLNFKTYINEGIGHTSMMKYAFGIFGFYSLSAKLNPNILITAAIAYGIFCTWLGWFWFKKGWKDYENEIQNKNNPFQREVRDAIASNAVIPD